MFCRIRPIQTLKMICFLAVFLLSVVALAQQAAHVLNNDDVIKMTHDGFDEGVIVALIESNSTEFDVSINGLTSLKAANVTGKVMEAMLKAEAKKRQAAGTPSSALAQPSSTGQNVPPAAMVPNPAMSAIGGGNMQQMMAMAMSMRGMGG